MLKTRIIKKGREGIKGMNICKNYIDYYFLNLCNMPLIWLLYVEIIFLYIHIFYCRLLLKMQLTKSSCQPRKSCLVVYQLNQCWTNMLDTGDYYQDLIRVNLGSTIFNERYSKLTGIYALSFKMCKLCQISKVTETGKIGLQDA